MLRTFQAGAELLGEEVVLQVARVIGSSMARVADATIAAFIVNVGAPSLEDDPGGLEPGAREHGGDHAPAPGRGGDGRDLPAPRRAAPAPAQPGDQRTQQLAVGFADLVGSTALAQRLSIRELGAALAEFDELRLGRRGRRAAGAW